MYLSRWGWAEPVHVGRGLQVRAVNIIEGRPEDLFDSLRLPGSDGLVLKRWHLTVGWLLPADMVGESLCCFGHGRISRRRRTIRWSEPGIVRGLPVAVEG